MNYVMNLSQTKTFDSADKCFETLLDAIDEAGKEGLDLLELEVINIILEMMKQMKNVVLQ